MRSLKIATCTSGDPVSPSLVAYSVMSACLRSTVMDTDLILSTIDDPRRSDTAVFDPSERDYRPIMPNAYDRTVDVPGDVCPAVGVVRRHFLPATQSSCFGRRQGQRRNNI